MPRNCLHFCSVPQRNKGENHCHKQYSKQKLRPARHVEAEIHWCLLATLCLFYMKSVGKCEIDSDEYPIFRGKEQILKWDKERDGCFSYHVHEVHYHIERNGTVEHLFMNVAPGFFRKHQVFFELFEHQWRPSWFTFFVWTAIAGPVKQTSPASDQAARQLKIEKEDFTETDTDVRNEFFLRVSSVARVWHELQVTSQRFVLVLIVHAFSKAEKGRLNQVLQMHKTADVVLDSPRTILRTRAPKTKRMNKDGKVQRWMLYKQLQTLRHKSGRVRFKATSQPR